MLKRLNDKSLSGMQTMATSGTVAIKKGSSNALLIVSVWYGSKKKSSMRTI